MSTTTTKYPQTVWSLDELYRAFDSDAVEQDLADLELKLADFEKRRDDLGDDVDGPLLLELLHEYEAILRLVIQPVYYGHLRFAEDTQNQQAQVFQARMQQLMASVDNRTLFFKLWWKALQKDLAESLLADSGDYRYWLQALRLQSPYTLSEPEEKVINLKDVNGPSALVTLYDSITNRYTFRVEVDGEVKEITRGELVALRRSPDPQVRASAYQEQFRVFGEGSPILGQIYQFLVRDWRSELVTLRGYASPISVRNLSNDIPDQVVDTLLEVCKGQTSLFQRFFKLKAKWLGMDRIRRYDVYAPVVKTVKTYPFEEASELVLSSFARFDKEVADLARMVFEEGHLDSEVRHGKRMGAFCATVAPDLTPYVLMSYQGQPNDIATLAHELGHAVHSLLARDHTLLTQQSTIPLAETASTFGEMLLVDSLLESEPSSEVQRALLFRQMDDAYATIMRQAYFAMFERDAHAATGDGASLDDLTEIYFDNLKAQFGDSLDLSDDFRFEWVGVPHFYHSPFYVYAYAFGQLLVLSLYEQYRQEAQSFKPRYLEILRSGGSASPTEILGKAGIEFRTAEFWRGGFRVLEDALERLEQLEPEG